MQTVFKIIFAVGLSTVVIVSTLAANLDVTQYYPTEIDAINPNSADVDVNDLWKAGYAETDPYSTNVDVTDHYTVITDVKDRQLKCYSGYVGQGIETLREKECHGSCATKPFGKGVIFDCAVAFVKDGCWKVQGSMTCFCNKPMCNDGTLPSIFLRFVDENLRQDV